MPTRSLLVLPLLLLGCSAPVVKHGMVATPEQAVRILEDAERAGDWEASLSLMTAADRKVAQKLKSAIEASEQADDELNALVLARFGRRLSPELPKVNFHEARPALRREVVRSNPRSDTEVELTVRCAPDADTPPKEIKVTAVKEDNGWRLHFPSESEGGPEWFEARAREKRELTEAVKSGKLKSLEDVRWAFVGKWPKG